MFFAFCLKLFECILRSYGKLRFFNNVGDNTSKRFLNSSFLEDNRSMLLILRRQACYALSNLRVASSRSFSLGKLVIELDVIPKKERRVLSPNLLDDLLRVEECLDDPDNGISLMYRSFFGVTRSKSSSSLLLSLLACRSR